jgi:hypothetical protein
LWLVAWLACALLVDCRSSSGAAPAHQPRTPDTRTAAASPTPIPAPNLRNEGQPNFGSLAALANYYRTSVFAPGGMPVGAPAAEESSPHVLAWYGYAVLGEMGEVVVRGAAPVAITDYQPITPPDADHPLINRRVVPVRGGEGVLLDDGFVSTQPGHIDTWKLLWAQDGQLLEAGVATIGAGGRLPTAGPDTLIALADDMQEFTPENAAKISTINLEPPSFGGEFASLDSVSAARDAYGAAIIAPPSFSSITVMHAGPIRSYSVDLDPQGNRRLFLAAAPMPTAMSDASAPGVHAAAEVMVRGTPGFFEQITNAAGTTSFLYFQVEGTDMLLEDAAGGSADDLVALAATLRIAR